VGNMVAPTLEQTLSSSQGAGFSSLAIEVIIVSVDGTISTGKPRRNWEEWKHHCRLGAHGM
jgi:hypothetical protein